MADGIELPASFGAKSDDNDDSEPTRRLCLDLGDDVSHNRLETASTSGPGNNDIANRREDNPFSFKHFLRSDASSYQHKGARPKVYSPAADADPMPRIAPEYSAALPDFVQDHLVVEQCYLGGNPAGGGFNLPDFAATIDGHRSHADAGRRNEHNDAAFPLDLPNRPDSASDVGVSKSLPDFLADGAVRSSQNSLESPEKEGDALRHELEGAKSQLAEQTRRVECLSRELEVARNKDQDYTQNLAKALEQVEDNLERSNVRCTLAENTVLKLRQNIKSLETQIYGLKQENRRLQGEEGAAGGHGSYSSVNEVHAQRLAQELKAAASSAEHSLRQLLTGVDNLRLMASSLENLHRVEETREDFLDIDEDTGPAL